MLPLTGARMPQVSWCSPLAGLVAERLVRFAELVGPERVIAGTDCGFGTAVGLRRVAPSIAWAKLATMVQGARLASQMLS